MKTSQRTVIFTVLASLVVGACAGVVASIFTSTALEDYATALLGDRGFTALEPRKPSANPLDYENAVRRVRDTQSRSLAVISSKTIDSAVPERWIGARDGDGLGVVVSANGWILTTDDELEGFLNPVTAAEVWVRGARYAIEEVIQDELTPYALLKLVEANGLTPVGFGASEDSRNGDLVFMLPNALSFVATSLEESEKVLLAGPQRGEVYVTAWELAVTGESGGLVLSTTGDMLGFVTAAGETIPLHHGVAFVQETIRVGVQAHAALGAYVIDVSDIYNLDPDIRQGLSTGALVFASTGRVAVPAKTPAALAGLRARDIITAVDGEAITLTTTLAEILAAYDPGQTARLSVVRDGAPLELPVVLGDAAALVY
ncbi:MAG: S1C family serine protease [Patescibacteria group bacterium]